MSIAPLQSEITRMLRTLAMAIAMARSSARPIVCGPKDLPHSRTCISWMCRFSCSLNMFSARRRVSNYGPGRLGNLDVLGILPQGPSSKVDTMQGNANESQTWVS